MTLAGKYRTAAVTDEGDVYMWEGLSKQHPHRKKAARDAALPPKPDKATSRRLSLSNVITPERYGRLFFDSGHTVHSNLSSYLNTS